MLLKIISVVLRCVVYSVVCFKQKTAYELRISDWSSDVGSSDLQDSGQILGGITSVAIHQADPQVHVVFLAVVEMQANQEVTSNPALLPQHLQEIGRASCRDRVCQYV